jgi:DNA polymerase III subunit delta
VILFWGDDPFLLRLAAHEVLDRRGLRATEVEASDWRGGETSDLATPSLWGERRALLVSRCEALPEAGQRELRAYLSAPSPEALCLLTLVSSAKAPSVAKLVQGGGGQGRHVVLRKQDLPKWVLGRAEVRGLRMTGQGAAALVATLGEDPAMLDQAVEQLVTAFADRTVGAEQVHEQFQGLGEQRVWDLCDQALAGRLPGALVVLRSLLEARHDPLMILGGIASRVRDLLRVRDVSDRLPTAEAARQAGLRYDWQLRRYREQAARFSPEELVDLHSRVVEADRALKGGLAGEIVLSSLVAVMSGEREATLDVPVRVSR